MSAISDKHAALAKGGTLLGAPTGNETTCPDNVGRFRHYAKGSIYWHPSSGAHAVHGKVNDHWAALGWERSWLGYPRTDVQTRADGAQFSEFTNGMIRWKDGVGALDSHGISASMPIGTSLEDQRSVFANRGSSRLVALCAYHEGGALRFASTLSSEPGRAQDAIFGVEAKELDGWLAGRGKASVFPLLVSVTRNAAGVPLFSVVAERYAADEAVPRLVRDLNVSGDWLDPLSLRRWLAWGQENVQLPTSADLYKDEKGTLRAAIVLAPNPQRVAWNGTAYGSTADAGTWFDIYAAHGLSPYLMSRVVDGTTIALWRDDTLAGAGGWIMPWNLDLATFDAKSREHWAQGKYLISTAVTEGKSPRFTGIWSHRATPLANQWSVTGTHVPELAQFDEAMRAYMTSAGIRGGTLALTKGTRLVYARAFTWGPSNYAITTPENVFRIGSCIKAISTLVLLKLLRSIDPPWVTEETPIAMVLGLSTVKDLDFKKVTIKQLLRHESRIDWEKPDFNAAAVRPLVAAVSADKTYAGSTKLDCAKVLAADYDLVDVEKYANNNFVLVGAIIEKLTGKPFFSVLRAELLGPLGIERAFQTGGDFQNRPAGEVEYHLEELSLAENVMSADPNAKTLAGYGDGNPNHGDSTGATAFAAPDLARLLSCLTAGSTNTVVPPKLRDAFCPPDPANHRGWGGWPTGSGAVVYSHSGGLGNAHAEIQFRRGDDVALVAAFNRGARYAGSHAVPPFSALVEGVGTAWPGHDLFPQLGLPAIN